LLLRFGFSERRASADRRGSRKRRAAEQEFAAVAH